MFGVPTGVSCMVHDGEADCPKNLPNRMVVGSSVTDGRSCSSSCTCAPAASCNGGTLEVSTKAQCLPVDRSYQVDGTCNTAAALTDTYFHYTPPSGCKVTMNPSLIGKETFANTRTFCCADPFF
jgi:hypothetical protein